MEGAATMIANNRRHPRMGALRGHHKLPVEGVSQRDLYLSVASIVEFAVDYMLELQRLATV